MRKLIAVLAVAALASAPAALAKERNVKMFGPTSATAGKAWNGTISVKIDGKPADGMGPMVRIISGSGQTISIPSRATGKTGIYRVRVVFPSAGTWRVIVVDRYSGRAYEFARMKVQAT
jgi:hypothetical protein